MKSIPSVITLLLFLLPLFTFGQQPGGVADPIAWLIPQYNTEGNVELWEKAQGKLIGQYTAEELFNSNAAIKLNAEILGPELELGEMDLSKMQLFVVYAAQDSVVEKVVWAVHDGVQDALVSTTHRLADFQQGKFMNNLGQKKHQPQMSTYQRYVQGNAKANYQLVLGQKGKNQQIPVQNFVGKIAEVIVYDRVLNSQEKAKVETYLALKYGIGIDKQTGQSWYSAQDQKIWDVQKLFAHSNAIAGIGRDDSSGLQQKQSSAVYEDNIFSLALETFQENNAVHQSGLMDQQFLLWGESEDNLQLEEKRPGQIQQLNKTWLLRKHGFTTEATQLKYDLEKLPFEKNAEEIFWLVIDRSGSGEFPLGATEYLAMDNNEDAAVATFSAVSWEGSARQIFTLAVGPKMIPTVWVEQPNCAQEEFGLLHVGAQGGKAPYHFVIKDDQNKMIAEWQANTSEPQSISAIESGQFHLRITDSQDWKYEETFFINPADAVFSNLRNQYNIAADEVLRLDASLGLDQPSLEFEWQLPHGQKHFSPTLDINAPGEYLLNIYTDDCQSQQRIHIEKQLLDNFKHINVFPNPSLGGYFEIATELFQSGPLSIKIINAAGSTLREANLPANHRHRYQDHLLAPGFYFLQLTSNNSTETRKLIVHARP